MAKDDIKLAGPQSGSQPASQIVPIEEIDETAEENDLTLFEGGDLNVFGDDLTDTVIQPDASGPPMPPIDGGIIGTGGSDDDDEDGDDDDNGNEGESYFDGFDTSHGSVPGTVLVGVGDEVASGVLIPAARESELVASAWVACLLVGVLSQIYGFAILVNRLL